MAKLLYDLRYHSLGDWSLHRWLVTLLLLVAVVLAWFGRREMPGLYGLAAVLLAVAAIALVMADRTLAAHGYVHFEPDAEASTPEPAPLLPDHEVSLYASGPFEVQEKSRYFAALPARFCTFATREHAVIARVFPTRILFVGQMPHDLVGMWYIFFRPDQLHAVEPGTLTFGRLHLPALHVTYNRPSQAVQGRRAAERGQADVYMAFKDASARSTVWADLLSDQVTTPPSPLQH